VEAHKILGPHTFLRIGTQMAVSFSALSAGRDYLQENLLVLISVSGLLNSRVIARLGRLSKLKNFNYLNGT
jgi:hypothetical protein